MLKGFTRKFKPLDILSEEEVEEIHRDALYVLEKTGMQVEHERALKLFAARDCRVDFEGKRVRIPSGLVEECLRQVPSSYVLKARDPNLDLMVGGNTYYFMQGMGMRYLDLDTWETRPATTAEHRDAMIVVDALENVHLADGVFFYMERQGIPPVMVMLENLASGLRYSAKAEQFGYQKDCEIFAIQMAQCLGINLNPEMDTASPLTIYSGAVEAAFRYVEAGIPIQPCASMTMGAEGPVTNAGAIVLATATVMAWAVLTQLIKPRAPMSIQHGQKPMDMRRGSPRFGAVGYALTGAMLNQMLRKYHIPSCPGSGFTSLSKKIDYQVGYEKSMGALVSALSGGHLQIFQGGSCAELLHPVLSILDDDVAGWIGHFLEGATVSDETLAVDLINEVGPIPGHYLSTAHTREWWRKEQYVPKVADGENYAVWVRSGKKDAMALAKEKMSEILATHKPKPLSAQEEQGIEDILKEARAYYRNKNLISDAEWSDYMKTLQSAN
jgi:trimethylamine--corrinoid protein Co-methyltransferase